VTSLTAEAASLFSRSVGCVTGQSGPQDVACGLFVGLGRVATDATSENRLGDAILRGCMPAGFATVRSMAGIDVDPDAPSFFRFGAQNRDELPPASVTYASIEASFCSRSVRQVAAGMVGVCGRLSTTQHVGDSQIFDRDQVIAAHQIAREFVMKIAALVCRLAMPSCHRILMAQPVFRPWPCTGQASLSPDKFACGGPCPARILHVEAVRGGGETGNTQIDADLTIGCRERSAGDIVAGQDQHPALAFAADLNCLYPADRLAMRADFDLPYALQVHTAPVRMPAGAIPILGPDDTVKAADTLVSGISRLSATFHPAEEPVEGSIQSAQRSLLTRERPHRQIWAYRPDLAQLRRLVAIANMSSGLPPSVSAFLQRSVVQLPVPLHTPVQGDVLTGSRPHPELVRAPHRGIPERRWALGVRARYLRHNTVLRNRNANLPREGRTPNSAMIAKYKRPPTTSHDDWSDMRSRVSSSATCPRRAC
jgi:hypothetical protein